MTTILAIDPGNSESAYALIDGETGRPLWADKLANASIFTILDGYDYDRLAIEMVASYGMPVGREVFETCVWIGRFQQHALGTTRRRHVELVYRLDVKRHHCHDSRAKDSNITQALVDRFAPGQPNRGKGTKAEPGWFHGFRADIWQAYALAVYVADTLEDGAA